MALKVRQDFRSRFISFVSHLCTCACSRACVCMCVWDLMHVVLTRREMTLCGRISGWIQREREVCCRFSSWRTKSGGQTSQKTQTNQSVWSDWLPVMFNVSVSVSVWATGVGSATIRACRSFSRGQEEGREGHEGESNTLGEQPGKGGEQRGGDIFKNAGES